MGQFGVDLGDIVFPVRAVEFLEAELEIGVGVERAQIDGPAVRVRARHVEGLHAAFRAEHVLRGVGSERVGRQALRPAFDPEIILLDEEMDKAGLGTDRAIARQGDDTVRQVGGKADLAAMALAVAPGFAGGVGHCLLRIADSFGRLHDVIHARQGQLFQIAGIGQRDVFLVDAGGRGVEIVEGLPPFFRTLKRYNSGSALQIFTLNGLY